MRTPNGPESGERLKASDVFEEVEYRHSELLLSAGKRKFRAMFR